MEKEIWLPVVGYEWLYDVSNLWNVRSLHYRKKLHCIKNIAFNDCNWYVRVTLSRHSKWHNYLVHRMVAQAFIQNMYNRLEINHKNWIKTDNRIENLEWCTREENNLHRYRVLWYKHIWSNLWLFWEDCPNSKKILQFTMGWKLVGTFYWWLDVCRKTWFNASAITACCRWKTKYSHWYKREYTDRR